MIARIVPWRTGRVAAIAAILALAAGGLSNPSAASAAQSIQVLPRPTSWQAQSGSFSLSSLKALSMRPGQQNAVSIGARPVVQQTVSEVLTTFANDLFTTRAQSVPVRTAAPPKHAISFALADDASLGTEGYQLAITPTMIEVTAQTSAGLFYATRSLEQMTTTGGQVPCGTMTDVPDIAQRFVFIDAARKYFSIDYLKDLVRQMAQVKLNTLHLHLAEAEGFRLNSPKYPGLTDSSVSYSESQIKDLVEFARRLQVDIVPGFEFPGHATVVSDYFHVGMGDGANPCTPAQMHSHLTPNWVIDFTSQAGRDVSTGLLRTFLPWFTSPYVHLGGDELPTQLGGCGRVQEYIANTADVDNFGDALVHYVNDIDSTARALGKTSIIFNGFENMSPSVQQLNADIMIMDWEGEGTNPAFDGHEILTSNSGYAYLTPNNYHNKIPNLNYISETWDIKPGDRLGAGLSVWADYNMWAQDQYVEQQMALPRAVIADRLWNTSKPTGGADAIVAIARSLPKPPSYQGFAPIGRVGAGQPRYHYTFEKSAYPPGYHWAGSPGNTIMLADSTGRLNGSSYILWNPVVANDGVRGAAWQFNDNNSGVGLGGIDIAPPWTFAVWVKPSAWVTDAVLMSSFGGQIRLVAGAVVLVDSAGNQTRLATGQLPLDEWTQLTVVASPQSTRVFVNGSPKASARTTIAMPMKAIGDVRGTPMYRGQLDEMSIYDAALSDQQVANLCQTSRNDPTLEHEWTLSEGQGGIAHDRVTGAAATIDGAQWVSSSPRGAGLEFDGINDGLNLDSAALSGNWAASLWVERQDDADSTSLFSDLSVAAALRLSTYGSSANQVGYTRIGQADYASTYSVPKDQWVQLAFASDGVRIAVYADGERVSTIAAANAVLGLDQFGRLVRDGVVSDPTTMAATDLRVYSGTFTALDAWRVYSESVIAFPRDVHAGQVASFKADGYLAGEKVTYTVSKPNGDLVRTLSEYVPGDGHGRVQWNVPTTQEPGRYTVTVSGPSGVVSNSFRVLPTPRLTQVITPTFADTNNDGVRAFGDDITTRVAVTNAGNVSVDDFTVTQSVVASAAGPAVGQKVRCQDNGQLRPTQTRICTITSPVTAAELNAGKVSVKVTTLADAQGTGRNAKVEGQTVLDINQTRALAVNSSVVRQGQKASFEALGFYPGNTVTFTVRHGGATAGTVSGTVSTRDAANAVWLVPDTAALGQYTVTAHEPGGQKTATFTVAAKPVPNPPSGGGSADGNGSGGRAANNASMHGLLPHTGASLVLPVMAMAALIAIGGVLFAIRRRRLN